MVVLSRVHLFMDDQQLQFPTIYFQHASFSALTYCIFLHLIHIPIEFSFFDSKCRLPWASLVLLASLLSAW